MHTNSYAQITRALLRRRFIFVGQTCYELFHVTNEEYMRVHFGLLGTRSTQDSFRAQIIPGRY